MYLTTDDLPICLRQLTQHQQDQISTTLANDEASSDDEIVDLWTQECGIPQKAAEAAVKFRSEYLLDICFDIFK